ncbi:MAG TPA: DUF192 domain-containing protein [Acidimicrobiales bacterium]
MHRTPSRSPRPPRRRGRWGRSAAAVVVGLAVLACGGGDDEVSGDSLVEENLDSADTSATTGVEPERPGDGVLISAGDAPAAQGAGLDEPPGPEVRELLAGFGEVAIAVHNPDGSIKGWCVLLAETQEQRNQGLMEVTDLGGYEGMLFVWDEDSSSGFWMKDTPMPLSIAFVDAEGGIVSMTDMEPCVDQPSCPTYAAEGPYRFALEVPKGRLGALGIEVGSTIRVGGGCAT